MSSPERVNWADWYTADTDPESRDRVVIQPQPIMPTQFEVSKNIHFSTLTELKNSLDLSNLDTSRHFNNESININLTKNELDKLKNDINRLSTDNSKINKIKEIITSQTQVIDQSKNDRITLQKEITEKLNNFDITNVKASLDVIERLKDPQDKAFLTNYLIWELESKGYSISLNNNKIEVNSNKQWSLKDELKNLFNNYIESSNFDINTFKNAILYRTTTFDNYVAANTDWEWNLIVDKMNSKTYYDFLLKKYNLDTSIWPTNIDDIKNHQGIDKKDKVFMISYYQDSFDNFPIDQSIKQFKEKEEEIKNNISQIPKKDIEDFKEKTKIIDDRSLNQRTWDFLRDPFREINLIMWKAWWIWWLAILGSIIYFMFKKPKEMFGWIAVWWLLKGLWVMDEIWNTFDWDYNERIKKWSKKAFDWAEEKFKKIPGIDINFSSNLIERGKDWFNFKDVKIWKWDDAKSVIDTDFTDLYNISEKNEFKDKLFIWKNNIWDKKYKALKWKLEELYNKWIDIYASKDKFFKIIQWKNIMEVEALVDKKEQENKKSIEENPNSGKPETEKEIDITSTTNSEKYELKEIHKFSLTWTLALLYSDIISKTRNLNNLTNKWFNSIIQTINKIKNDEDYKKKSVEERQEIDIWLTQEKTFYRNQLNKLQTKLLDSFIAGISDNLNSVETYLNEFKNKFSDISTYSKEQLTEFKNKFEEFKKTDKYNKLSDDTKIKINIMLTEIQDKFEEKFKNLITFFDQEFDLDNVDNINLDNILIYNKNYSKDELKSLTSQIIAYKKGEKFNWLEQPQKTKITTFLDSLLEKYNDKLLSQEKNTFIKKIISSRTELINKFNTFADKNYNELEVPALKQNQITEFDKKLQAKIEWLKIDDVKSIDKLEKLTFEYKLFEMILNNYLDGKKDWDIIKFIDWYVFNDNKTYELWESELLDKVRKYDLKWIDQYDNQRKKNEVFIFIKQKVDEVLSNIDQKENAVLVNLYKKYLDNELSYSISSVKTPLGIWSITINDIETHFKPKNFTVWKNSLDWKLSLDDKIIKTLEDAND